MVVDLESAKKSKTGASSWLTRAAGSCDKLQSCNLSEVSITEYESVIQDFDKRLHSWDDSQGVYESFILDEEQIDVEINKAADFREKCVKSKVSLVSKWLEVNKKRFDDSSNGANGASSASSNHSVENNEMFGMARLPKLDLPKFYGDTLKFQPFWQQFEECVDKQPNFSAVSKFNYLISLLKGEARNLLDGLPITSENYTVAVSLLKKRYGRKELITFSHIQSLLNIDVPDTTNVAALIQFRDKLVAHVRSLEAMDITSDNFGLILTPLIVAKLPEAVRFDWAKESEGKEADLDYLMEFLQDNITQRQRCESYGSLSSLTQPSKQKSVARAPASAPEGSDRRLARGRHGSAVALHTVSKNCLYCNKTHQTFKCYRYLDLNVADRQAWVETQKLCFRCLSKNHFARSCKEKCAICYRAHHRSLCTKGIQTDQNESASSNSDESKNKTDSVNEVGSVVLAVNKSCISILPIASVEVKNATGSWSKATLLFDSGSDRSYIAKSVVDKMHPKFVKNCSTSFSTFGGGSHASRSKIFEISVKGCSTDKETSIQLCEVPVICQPMARPKISAELFDKFSHLNLATELRDDTDTLTIDLLIGQDLYWTLMLDNVERINKTCKIVAQESVFGWVLSGKGDTIGSNNGITMLNICEIPDNILKSFWDLESIGVSDKSDSVDPVLHNFESTVTYNDTSGRYNVKLPWKDNHPPLLNNESMAHTLLKGLNKRLERNETLKHEYDEALQEMEKNKHIIEVDEIKSVDNDRDIFYLPHHPHVRESSTSTKVRPVFNASCKGFNSVSLNDCLEKGPNLNPNISDLLIRFRRWPFALSADIKKAFLQIELHESDQDVHRFLWVKGDQLRRMKFTRVTFGINCSPFLLSATIKYHLYRCPQSTVIKELLDNLYVDDFLSGADSDVEAQNLFSDANLVMGKAGMTLTKWSSNHLDIVDTLVDGAQSDNAPFKKVLGVLWDNAGDVFTFVGVELPGDIQCTKRVVLSLIARIFDPLGLILPTTMTARFMFQDVWRLGLDWDEVLPSDLKATFEKWLVDIKNLQNISIPRQYFVSARWSCVIDTLELHAFGDASLRGYGACVYLRYQPAPGQFETALVKSCAKVAPLERKTLPRLELLACVITAQLLTSVISSLRLPSDTSYTCWSDSMVSLGWIRGDPSRWKPFVSNRVSTIHSLTKPANWKHIAGKVNPADLLSRGVSAEKLLGTDSELWWKGPPFLRQRDVHDVSRDLDIPTDLYEMDAERKDHQPNTVLCCSSVDPSYQFDRWSYLNKAFRVIAWTLRFINKIRKRETGNGKSISQGEYREAKLIFIKILQRQHFAREIDLMLSGKPINRDSKLIKLGPFLDDSGVLRVRGRIQLADIAYESKHPIILPKCHGSMLLIRFTHNHMNHSGVDTLISTLKKDYEIIGLRQMAKSVKRCCVACKRIDAKSCNEVCAPLPKVRVTRAPVFSVTGIDFAGPVYCSDFPNKKFYLCLFVCGVVRAIHLELVESLNTNDFVLAFRRFAALKRVPSVVYSDNGTNLVGGSKTIGSYLGPNAPQWRFICPRSPWWGGWWERLVRSVKNGIRKTLGKRCLTRTEMETCIPEVACSVNSRPLTFVGTSIEDKPPLTPNHFLAGQGAQSLDSRLIEDPENTTTDDLIERKQEMCERLDHFWEIWSKEYLRNLPPSFQKFKKQGNLQSGSVVLIQEDGLPRLRWCVGIVQKLHKGKDGNPRAADVKTARGIRTRAVQRLHNLEVTNPDDIPEGPVDIVNENTESEYTNDETRIAEPEKSADNARRPVRSKKIPSKFEDYKTDL